MDRRKHEFTFGRKEFDLLRNKVTEFSGIQADESKFEMFYARLAKRLRVLNFEHFQQYVDLIEQDEQEFIRFINAITTNVTSFGREQHHFEYLKQQLFQQQGLQVNIWSAGCSSGEEPYSIAMNLHPLMASSNGRLAILATDLDSDILDKAAEGVYDLDAIEHYDLTTKRNYFRKGTGQNQGKCQVKPVLKSLITFEQLNLIKPWDLSRKFDVIFCRNVMIYFDVGDKQRLINKYADHLNDDGILCLGHSESLHSVTDRFKSVGRTIFRKIN